MQYICINVALPVGRRSEI